MRQEIWWPATWALVVGGSLLLAGAGFGGENENSDRSKNPAGSTNEQAGSQDQRGGQSDQKGSDEVRHHATLGMLISKSEDGVHIVGVMPGSPADHAGLRVGDEIRYVGDERIRTTQGLTEEVRKYKPGSQVDLSIRRNGERQIVKAKLSSGDLTVGDGDRSSQTPNGQNGRSANRGDGQANRSRGSYSYAPNSRQSADSQQASQQIRALQQQISRLQQEIDNLQRNQNSRLSRQQEIQNPNWGWNGHGTMDDDPALFQ
jgi:hypothetical protein